MHQTTPFCAPRLVAETQTFRLSRLGRQHPGRIIHDDNFMSLSLATLKSGKEPGNDGPPSSICSTHPDPLISWTRGTRDEISPTPGTVSDRGIFMEGFCVMKEETIKLKNRYSSVSKTMPSILLGQNIRHFKVWIYLFQGGQLQFDSWGLRRGEFQL